MTGRPEDRWETALEHLTGQELLELLRKLEHAVVDAGIVRPWDDIDGPSGAQRHRTANEMAELIVPVLTELRGRLG